MKTTVHISSKEIEIFVYITCSKTKKTWWKLYFIHWHLKENLASAFVLTCTEPGQCRGEPVLWDVPLGVPHTAGSCRLSHHAGVGRGGWGVPTDQVQEEEEQCKEESRGVLTSVHHEAELCVVTHSHDGRPRPLKRDYISF